MNIEQHKLAKLTWKDVHYIRAHYRFRSKTNGRRALAHQFGVSHTCIGDIVSYRSWKADEWHIDRGEYHSNHVLNWDKVKYIRDHYPEMSMQKLANKFGVCKRTIYQVIHNQAWKE